MPITYRSGDLFGVLRRAKGPLPVLAHACNCLGSWGGGIALQFRKRYPEAYKVYARHCEQASPEAILGTTLLIPTQDCTIACLFTSIDGGGDIVESTRCAMEDLVRQTKQPVFMPMINAGIFGVQWEVTEHVLKNFDIDITVYTL